MKRKFLPAILLCICIFLLPIRSSATTITHLDDNLQNINVNNEFLDSLPENYFPFVYDDNDNWLVEYLGPNECVPGYLYAQDLRTNEITLLLDEPVKIIRETYYTVFCITESNKIVASSYTGDTSEVIYEAHLGSISLCERLGSKLYFVEGTYIISLDVISGESQVVLRQDDTISHIFPYTEDSIEWSDSTEQRYLLTISTGTNEAITEQAFENMLATEVLSISEDCDASILAVSASQESFPLSDYPVGSYFTVNGAACTDHGTSGIHLSGTCNCKMYAAGSQCYGFAYYASDKYAHINGSTWSRPSTASDDVRLSTTFSTDTAMKQYFSSFNKGAYLRLSKTAPSGSGNHSIVLVSVSSTGISTYECNVDGKCGVTTRTFTFSSLRSKYPYVSSAFSHTFDGTCSLNSSTHHKQYCSSSGCTGYVLKAHYSYNPGTNATCAACGYIGNIDVGIAQ